MRLWPIPKSSISIHISRKAGIGGRLHAPHSQHVRVGVTDADQNAGIELARIEGLMVGPTTGALLHAARLTGACNDGTAVVISLDDATKYISTYAEYLARQEED